MKVRENEGGRPVDRLYNTKQTSQLLRVKKR